MSKAFLIVAIILQFIAIGFAFSSFFLPLYKYEAKANVNSTQILSQTVDLRFREFICTTNIFDKINETKFIYDDRPDFQCVPFFVRNQDMTDIGYYMNTSLTILAIGICTSIIALFFQIFISCYDHCRNCAMKVITFLFSIVPIIFYLASPLILIFYKHIKSTFDDSNSASEDHDIAFCDQTYCDKFYGKESTILIPYFGYEGSVKWGPEIGWVNLIVSSFICFLSAILTIATPSYEKYQCIHD